jgi:hypothetical protein
MNATSFINERSADYALVSEIHRILNGKKYAILFPRKTRENSKISQAIHKDDKFSVFGVFSRRPKFHIKNDQRIQFKINQNIIAANAAAVNYGIPMVIGAPLANSFWELNRKFIWLDANQFTTECILPFGHKTNYNTKNQETSTKQIDMKIFAPKVHNEFDLGSFFGVHEEIIGALEMNNRSMWGSVYKPFYVFQKL